MDSIPGLTAEVYTVSLVENNGQVDVVFKTRVQPDDIDEAGVSTIFDSLVAGAVDSQLVPTKTALANTVFYGASELVIFASSFFRAVYFRVAMFL